MATLQSPGASSSNPLRRLRAFFTAGAREETRLWLSIGGPIVGLIALIAVSTLVMLASIARGQDRAHEVAEAQLVGRSMEGIGESVSASAKDFGIWNDAYRNITERWNAAWVKENMYSSAVDGLVVFRADGSVRHVWTAGPYADLKQRIASVVASEAASPERLARIAAADTTDAMVARNYIVLDGLLLAVATVPVRRETSGVTREAQTHGVTDYVAALEILDAARTEKLAQSLGVRGLEFHAGSAPPPHAAVRLNLMVPNHEEAPVGWFSFEVQRPGSQAFARRAVTIAAALGLFGLLAFLVSRSLVERQIRALAQAQRAAEDANRVKSQFLANMSHELRTPLNAVIGYAELLEEDAVAAGRAKQGDDSRRISSAARHLLGLINDILEHSRIEAGKIDLHYEETHVAPLLDEVADLVRVAAEKNNVTLKVGGGRDLATAWVDRMRLKQCLVNLASNAVKFTQDGRVSIAARPATIDGVQMIVFDVIDTGIGISPEGLEKLFLPFAQADSARNRRFGGTGLGLSITRRLIEAMGGAVTVRSEPGAGSTFTLMIPRGEAVVAQAA